MKVVHDIERDKARYIVPLASHLLVNPMLLV